MGGLDYRTENLGTQADSPDPHNINYLDKRFK